MGNQKLSPKRSLEGTKSVDPLEVTKSIEPPPIDDVVQRAQQALKLNIKKKLRKHRCYVCHSESCSHYEREYLDDLGTRVEIHGFEYQDLEGNKSRR